MNRLPQIFVVAVSAIVLLSACGPAAPTSIPPIAVAQTETLPAVARPTAVTSTPTTALPAIAGCPAPAGWSAYAVKSGDTLIALAKQVNRTVEELMQANCLTSQTIGAGSTLYLPLESCTIAPPEGWRPYSVRSGDTLFSLASARGTTVGEVKHQNCLVSDALDVGKRLYLPPAPPITPAPVVQPQAPVATPGSDGVVKLPTDVFFAPQATPTLPGSSKVTLPSEVFLGVGGGGGPTCSETPPRLLPAIEIKGLTLRRGDQLTLCAYGFPLDEDLTVIVYTERGTIGTEIVREISDTNPLNVRNIVSVQSGEQAGHVAEGNSLALYPRWPLDLPDPTYIQINSANQVARQTVNDAQLGQRVGFLQTAGYTPFADWVPFQKPCPEVTRGTTLQFLGAGYKPGQQIPIGLYAVPELVGYAPGVTLTLTSAAQITADDIGRFQYPVTVSSSDKSGKYYVMALTDPDQRQLNPFDLQFECYTIP